MSNLPGENYHAAKSIEIHNRVARANNMDVHQAMYDMACAQNLATLTLAYEQRTANLLKVLELQGRMQDVHEVFRLSETDVAPRLGLGKNK